MVRCRWVSCPVVCHALALGAVLLPLARRDRLEGDTANALFLFLGQATFAAAVGPGLPRLLERGHPERPAPYLAMPIAVAGMPILIGGALVHRLLEQAPPETERRNRATSRGLSPERRPPGGHRAPRLTGMARHAGALVLTGRGRWG